MFKTKKIQRRANEIYSQIWQENTNITIKGTSKYIPNYKINFRVSGQEYEFCICDGSISVRYGCQEDTNSMEVASFVALAIASIEFGRKPEIFASTFNRCQIIL